MIFEKFNNEFKAFTLKQKGHFCLVVLLALLGLGQSISFTLGFEKMQHLFKRSAASPLSFVFSVHKGREYWSSNYELKITTEGGKQFVIPMGAVNFASLEGPYKIRLITISSFLFANQLTHRRLKWSLGTKLCKKDGRLNKAFKINRDLLKFEIKTMSQSTGRVSKRTVDCIDFK